MTKEQKLYKKMMRKAYGRTKKICKKLQEVDIVKLQGRF